MTPEPPKEGELTALREFVKWLSTADPLAVDDHAQQEAYNLVRKFNLDGANPSE